MNDALREELREMEVFSCSRFYGQRVEPVSAATFKVDMLYTK